jgi:hypothetical protein
MFIIMLITIIHVSATVVTSVFRKIEHGFRIIRLSANPSASKGPEGVSARLGKYRFYELFVVGSNHCPIAGKIAKLEQELV